MVATVQQRDSIGSNGSNGGAAEPIDGHGTRAAQPQQQHGATIESSARGEPPRPRPDERKLRPLGPQSRPFALVGPRAAGTSIKPGWRDGERGGGAMDSAGTLGKPSAHDTIYSERVVELEDSSSNAFFPITLVSAQRCTAQAVTSRSVKRHHFVVDPPDTTAQQPTFVTHCTSKRSMS